MNSYLSGLTGAAELDRPAAEAILGRRFHVRGYSSHGDVSRGIAHVESTALTAYVLRGGDTVVGVLSDTVSGAVSLVLAPAGEVLSQSDIAEAVDFWESGNTFKVWCLHEKSCGAVIFTDAGPERLYLMIRMNASHCGLPKGHVEKFETEKEAAVREIREETGVDVTLFDGFRETVEYPISAKTRKESVYFVGRFEGTDVKIQESEIVSYKLCPYEEARLYITHENDRAVFDAAVRWLGEHHI